MPGAFSERSFKSGEFVLVSSKSETSETKPKIFSNMYINGWTKSVASPLKIKSKGMFKETSLIFPFMIIVIEK